MSSFQWPPTEGQFNVNVSSPLLYNSGTNTLSILQANGSQAGYLSAADWTTFNNKANSFTVASPLSLNGGLLSMTAADGAHSGYVTTVDQTFFGTKTFNNALIANSGLIVNYGYGFLLYNTTSTYYAALSAPPSLAASYLLTLPATAGSLGQALITDGFGNLSWALPSIITSVTAANGLTLTGGTLALGTASTSTTGALTSTDWNTFNSKASGFTVSSPLSLSGGVLSMTAADLSNSGYVTTATQSFLGTKTFYGPLAAYDGVSIGYGTSLYLFEPTNTYYAGLRAPHSLAATYILTLPATSGATAQTLITDGSGALSWTYMTPPSIITAVTQSDGLTLTSGTLALGTASAGTTGALTSTDWATFNSKANSFTVASPLSLSGGVLSMTAAGLANSGYVTTAVQAFQGTKTFYGTLVANNGLTVGSGSWLHLFEPTNTYCAALVVPTNLATNYTLTLPATAGSLGQALITDGTGVLSWASPSIITAVTQSNGLTLTGATLVLGTASSSTTGALTSTDWTTFNAKQPAGSYVLTSSVGAVNGVAPLDSGGKVPYTNLPSTLMIYLGAWNASTNSPTLADGTGTNGDVYRVSVAGTRNLGSGSQTFFVGDFVIYNGSIWQRSPAADGVISVNGASGAVTVNAINQLTGDVTTSAASGSQSLTASLVATSNTTLTSLANLATIGTITSGTWHGSTLGVGYGGTGQTSASAAFNALSPITSAGDLILGNGVNSAGRLGIGANGYVLTSNGTTASWATPGTPAFSGLTQYGLAYANTTATLATISTGTSGQFLTSNGNSSAPSWTTPLITSVTAANGLTLTGQTLSLGTASTSTTGALLNTDWNTFNNKQAAGSYITALTGDVTASGPGSASATLTATSNTTLTSLANLATVGTITSGTWQGSTLGVGYGGTGTSTAFTAGSVVYAGASGVYSQDNSHFFWDATNHRLGLGATGPNTTLSITSGGGSQTRALYISSGDSSNTPGGIFLTSATNVGGDGATVEAIGQRSDSNSEGRFSGQLALARLQTNAALASSGINIGRILFGANPSGTTLGSVLYAASIAGVTDSAWANSTNQATAIVLYTGQAGQIPSSGGTVGTERFRVASSGRISTSSATTRALSTNQDAADTSGYFECGTYTPSYSNGGGSSSYIHRSCKWKRVGTVVTVSGYFDFTITAANSVVYITTPIAFTRSTIYDAAGVGIDTNGHGSGAFATSSGAGNSSVVFYLFNTATSGTVDIAYTYQYQIQ